MPPATACPGHLSRHSPRTKAQASRSRAARAATAKRSPIRTPARKSADAARPGKTRSPRAKAQASPSRAPVADIPSPWRERIQLLKKDLARRHIHAMLVASPCAVRYLSGFQSSFALVLIDRAAATLVTDGRYIEAARKQLPGWTTLCSPRADLTPWWKAFWKQRAYRAIGFEGSAAWDQVQSWKYHARPAKFVEAGEALQKLREVKDPTEIAALRKAARLADHVMQRAIAFIQPGMKEVEVSRHIRRLVDEVGAEGESFPNIVASGPNSSRPHHHPGQRRIRAGDFVILDLGVIWKGYCSDITRTVAVGHASDEMRRVYHECLRAQKAALKAVRAGVDASDPDTVARRILAQSGLDEYFVHGLGHGVGLEIHEAPTLSARGDDTLQTNMAVTVEPGVYLPAQFGVRIEDLTLVTPNGPKVLSRTPKELKIL